MSSVRGGVTLVQVWISLTDSINATRERQRLALSTCMRCHSGGMLGPVVCENGYVALQCSTDLRNSFQDGSFRMGEPCSTVMWNQTHPHAV